MTACSLLDFCFFVIEFMLTSLCCSKTFQPHSIPSEAALYRIVSDLANPSCVLIIFLPCLSITFSTPNLVASASCSLLSLYYLFEFMPCYYVRDLISHKRHNSRQLFQSHHLYAHKIKHHTCMPVPHLFRIVESNLSLRATALLYNEASVGVLN